MATTYIYLAKDSTWRVGGSIEDVETRNSHKDGGYLRSKTAVKAGVLPFRCRPDCQKDHHHQHRDQAWEWRREYKTENEVVKYKWGQVYFEVYNLDEDEKDKALQRKKQRIREKRAQEKKARRVKAEAEQRFGVKGETFAGGALGKKGGARRKDARDFYAD